MTPQVSDAPSRDIVVIGASAGGLDALRRLVGGLPPELPAAVFIVQHLPAYSPKYLPQLLARMFATHAQEHGNAAEAARWTREADEAQRERRGSGSCWLDRPPP